MAQKVVYFDSSKGQKAPKGARVMSRNEYQAYTSGQDKKKKSSNTSGKPKKPSVKVGSNARTADKLRRRVEQQGLDSTTSRQKPGFWDKLFGTLNAGGVGVRGVLNNVFTNKDVNILGEMGKSVRGEDTLVDADDLLKNFGLMSKAEPTSWGAKVGRGAATLAVDMLTDPLTYMTWGMGAATKSKYAGNAASVLTKGTLSADRAADLSKYAKGVGNLAGQSIDEMGIAGQRVVSRALKREARDLAGEGFLHIKPIRSLGMKDPVSIYRGTGANSLVSRAQDNLLEPIISKLDSVAPSARKALSEVVGHVSTVGEASIGSGKLYGAGVETAKQAGLRVRRGMANIGEQSRDYIRKTAKDAGLDGEDLIAMTMGIGDYAKVTKSIEKRRIVNELTSNLKDERSQLQRLMAKWDGRIGDMDELAVKQMDTLKATISNTENLLKEAKVAANAVNTLDAPTLKNIINHIEERSGKAYTAEQRAAVGKAVRRYSDDMSKIRQLDGAADLGIAYVPGIGGEIDKGTKEILERITGKPISVDRGAGDAAREILGSKSNVGSLDFTATKNYETVADRLDAGVSSIVDLSELSAARHQRVGAALGHDVMLDEAMKLAKPLGMDNPKHLKELIDSGIPRGEIVTRNGKLYQMNSDMAQQLKNYQELFTVPAKRKGITRAFQWYSNTFKRWALATPGFISRNEQSNIIMLASNNALDSKTFREGGELLIALTYPDRIKAFSGKYADDVMRTMGDGSQATWGELVNVMREYGIIDGGRVLDIDFNDRLFKNVRKAYKGEWFTDLVSKANGVAEGSARATAFLNAVDKGMDYDDAARFVNRILYSYDPYDLTLAERNIRNFIPFYTWIRRNLPAQVSLLVNDPSKISIYGKIGKASAAAAGSPDQSVIPEYMKDGFVIPFPMPNGKNIYFYPNFAFGDLQKLEGLVPFLNDDNISARFRTTVDEIAQVMNPLIKVGVEIGLNRDFFYKGEITRYDGELKPAHPLIGGAIKRMGGLGLTIRQDGAVMIPAETMKLLQLHPLYGNIMRWTDNGSYDYATDGWGMSPKQISRLLSSIVGIKTYPEEMEKWQDQAHRADAEYLRDTISSLESREMFNEEADEALDKVFSDEDYRARKEAEKVDPAFQQYVRELQEYNDLVAVEKLRARELQGKRVDYEREAEERAQLREDNELKWLQEYAAKQTEWDENVAIAEEYRRLMESLMSNRR